MRNTIQVHVHVQNLKTRASQDLESRLLAGVVVSQATLKERSHESLEKSPETMVMSRCVKDRNKRLMFQGRLNLNLMLP